MFSKKPTLIGDRVTLRPVGPEHVDGLLELCADDEVGRLTGSHAGPVDRATCEQWYATRGELAERLDLAILAGSEYVGEVVLNHLDAPNRACNLRIALIGSRVFGRGYGTEAIELLLRHAFTTTPLHRISLDVFTFNPRAIRVYEKVGFVQEGVNRDALFWEGEWHDSIPMAVLRPEWEARNL
ncbi:GNAT family N-acetyltransferase [Nonomuraea sp. NBC_01738]|uniref:GNAT family N-acetyltransferase n=1 Tax=Nonomuraea sp. NBC_01738 TaxID=2976003 RepID=UPI002E141D82|nr:GNAT family N-acetyltransferase [Nonomuraea sp. NBC_01738]